MLQCEFSQKDFYPLVDILALITFTAGILTILDKEEVESDDIWNAPLPSAEQWNSEL